MPIIDCHVHCWDDRIAALVETSELRRIGPQGAFKIPGTVGALLEHFDSCAVDKGVILPVATKPRQVDTINRWASRYLGHERIVPFAAIHPDTPDPARTVAAIAAAGFKGVKMHPLLQHFRPQDERVFPLYEAIIEHDLVLVFHSGTGLDTPSVPDWKTDFDAFFAHYPYERTVLAHLGGNGALYADPTPMPGRPGYIDLAWYLGIDRISDESIVTACRAHGCDRVLFGSDSPWVTTAASLERFRRLGFTAQEQGAILYDNAAKLLGL